MSAVRKASGGKAGGTEWASLGLMISMRIHGPTTAARAKRSGARRRMRPAQGGAAGGRKHPGDELVHTGEAEVEDHGAFYYHPEANPEPNHSRDKPGSMALRAREEADLGDGDPEEAR